MTGLSIWLRLAIVTALAGTATVASAQPFLGGGPVGRGPVTVGTAPVAVEKIGDQLKTVGTVTASRAVVLFAQVGGAANGLVTEVNFKAGDRVKEGAVLVRFDDSDQKIAVTKAEIALADAQHAYDRAASLAQTQNLTNTALSTAASNLEKARNDLRTAQVALDRRAVTAPFAGVVGLSARVPGEVVTGQTAITTLDDVSSFNVAFDAPQRFVESVKVGSTVVASAEGLPGVRMKGQVTSIDSRLDQVTRTFKVEAVLNENVAALKPGMAVIVTLDFAETEQRTVPSMAIQWDRRGSYVWRVENNVLRRAAVNIVGRRSGSVIVEGDLRADDEVVVEGLQRAREGATITRATR
ncbi:MAG: efflux RND transporter periplasmic adaptor subunit [Bauldia sp.]